MYKDSDTGFTFSQYDATYKYNSPNVITFRTAVPSSASAPYDVVLQLTALKEVAWLGVAWGGTMLSVPLTVAWPNGNTVTVSSRLTKYAILPPSPPRLFIMLLTAPQNALSARRIRRGDTSSPQDRYQGQLHALAGGAEVQWMYLVDDLLGRHHITQPKWHQPSGLRVLDDRAIDAVFQHIVIRCP